LFVVIKDTAMNVGEKLDQSGANLVQSAADFTLGKQNNTENFAEKWSTAKWDTSILGSADGEYGADASKLENAALNAAIANAAAIKARNTALAEYLASKGYGAQYSVFADYTYTSSNGTLSMVPKDAAAAILGYDNTGAQELDSRLAATLSGTDEENEEYLMGMLAEIQNYYGLDEDGNQVTGEALKNTPAYTDGLAYYALMSTVDTVNQGNSSDETYWDDMSSAVGMYGDIAAGKTSLEDLQTLYDALGSYAVENSVVITFVASEDGLVVTANPSAVTAE
jgi:hypothetical protein